jgi:hypothetical protein
VIYGPSCRLDIGLTWASHKQQQRNQQPSQSAAFGFGVATSDVLNLQRPIFNSWSDDVGNTKTKSLYENYNDIWLIQYWQHYWLGIKEDVDEELGIFISLTAMELT